MPLNSINILEEGLFGAGFNKSHFFQYRSQFSLLEDTTGILPELAPVSLRPDDYAIANRDTPIVL